MSCGGTRRKPSNYKQSYEACFFQMHVWKKLFQGLFISNFLKFAIEMLKNSAFLRFSICIKFLSKCKPTIELRCDLDVTSLQVWSTISFKLYFRILATLSRRKLFSKICAILMNPKKFFLMVYPQNASKIKINCIVSYIIFSYLSVRPHLLK